MKHLFLLLPLLLGLPLFVFAQESTSGFIPLTNIPQLTDLGNSFALDNFLNQLYRISIGIAAVVAVLQIMRAGIMYMGGDSVTNKKEARDLIGLSIGGLVLVLSPFIVFSIVNPSILSLKIDTSNLGTEIGRATTTPTSPSNNTRNNPPSTPNQNTCSPIAHGTKVPNRPEQQCCGKQSGCKVITQIDSGETVCSCQNPVRPDDEGGPFTFRFFVAYSELQQNGTRAPICLKTIEETVPLNSRCTSIYNDWLIRFAEDRDTYTRFATGKGCETAVYEIPTLRANWEKIKDFPACS